MRETSEKIQDQNKIQTCLLKKQTPLDKKQQRSNSFVEVINHTLSPSIILNSKSKVSQLWKILIWIESTGEVVDSMIQIKLHLNII